MFDILKKKIKKIIGENPIEIDGESYSFRKQSLILENYLKLKNVGFGIPYENFDLGEKILNKWIRILIENNDKEVSSDSESYIERLNESFKLSENEEKEVIEEYSDDCLRVFEGFAGYGGASFGLKRSGIKHRVIGLSEFDKYASELLDLNFPSIRNWGDITKIDPKKLPDFDMFTGGFPCQPFSSAGMQKGENDPYGRGTLFYHILRICEEKKPKYLLLENVKGLTQKKFEDTFNTIKKSLKEMGYGDMAYAVLNSKDYGIPQNRERLWMFARLGGLPKDFNIVPPKVEHHYRLGDFLDKNPPKDLYLSDEQIEHLKVKHHIPSFVVNEPLCFDVYNKKIKTDAMCITITQPEHNSLRVIEVPKADGKEIVRKLSVDEQFRLMGFKDNELNYGGQSYSQMSKRAGNGWDVNLVGILIKHIFSQL